MGRSENNSKDRKDIELIAKFFRWNKAINSSTNVFTITVKIDWDSFFFAQDSLHDKYSNFYNLPMYNVKNKLVTLKEIIRLQPRTVAYMEFS